MLHPPLTIAVTRACACALVHPRAVRRVMAYRTRTSLMYVLSCKRVGMTACTVRMHECAHHEKSVHS